MPEESEFQQLKKLYPDFFKEFPKKLMDLANSEKTASQISETCLKNEIEDEKTIEEIAYYITLVLLGRLPLNILPKALATNLKIDIEKAEKISREVNETIFSQAKDELAKLYQAKPSIEPKKSTAPPEEEPKKSPSKDVYRESLE